jgi:predicted ester cyclase
VAFDTEFNKSLVRQWFNAIESGEASVLDEILAPGHEHHYEGFPRGIDGMKSYLAVLRSALPDIKLPISAMVAEGNMVAVRNRAKGRHMGDFGPLKASGKRIDIAVFHLFYIEDGRIGEHHELADMMALQAQIRF